VLAVNFWAIWWKPRDSTANGYKMTVRSMLCSFSRTTLYNISSELVVLQDIDEFRSATRILIRFRIATCSVTWPFSLTALDVRYRRSTKHYNAVHSRDPHGDRDHGNSQEPRGIHTRMEAIAGFSPGRKQVLWHSRGIGVARGYTGWACTPSAEEMKIGAKFTGKSCKCTPSGRECTPEAEQE